MLSEFPFWLSQNIPTPHHLWSLELAQNTEILCIIFYSIITLNIGLDTDKIILPINFPNLISSWFCCILCSH